MPFNENEKRYNKLDKLAEGEKLQTVYSTEKVEKILKDMGKGLQVDMSPFFHGDTRYKDAGLLYNYTEHEIEELQKCADDCLYYVKNYCKFLNDKGRTLVQLRDYQEQYIQMLGEQEYDEDIGESIPKNRRIITMMARQSSKTTSTAAYMSWYMTFHTDKNLAIVANKGKTSQEIVSKVKEVFEGLPFFMKPGIIRAQMQSITLENGCYLMCATTNPTSITGQSNNVLYIDEAAHIPQNIMDAFWKSVYPTLSSFKNQQLIISSTPKGKQNLFYRI